LLFALLCKAPLNLVKWCLKNDCDDDVDDDDDDDDDDGFVSKAVDSYPDELGSILVVVSIKGHPTKIAPVLRRVPACLRVGISKLYNFRSAYHH